LQIDENKEFNSYINVWFNIKSDFSIFDHTSVYTNRAENYQIAFVRSIQYNLT